MNYQLFISYAATDGDSVQNIVNFFRQQSDVVIGRFDEPLPFGEAGEKQRREKLSGASLFVLMLSPQALASGRVYAEFREAAQLNKPMMIVILEPQTPLPAYINADQCVYFSNDPPSFARLRQALRMPQFFDYQRLPAPSDDIESGFAGVSTADVKRSTQSNKPVSTAAPTVFSARTTVFEKNAGAEKGPSSASDAPPPPPPPNRSPYELPTMAFTGEVPLTPQPFAPPPPPPTISPRLIEMPTTNIPPLPPVPPVPISQTFSPPPSQRKKAARPQKRASMGIIGIIGAVAIVSIAIIGGIFLGLSSQDDTGENDNPSSAALDGTALATETTAETPLTTETTPETPLTTDSTLATVAVTPPLQTPSPTPEMPTLTPTTLSPTPTIPTATPTTPGPTLTPSPTIPTATPTPDPFVKVTRNSDWTPVVQVFNGVEMVLVPAGCFSLYDNLRILATPCISTPFWIDKTEVTNRAFGFTDETANLPRTSIGWEEAKKHCEDRGGRLPSEEEWIYAASGPDNNNFPWGGTTATEEYPARYATNSGGRVNAVGGYPEGVSWVGALDMSGNVWEWTATHPRPDETDGVNLENRWVIGGGSYKDEPHQLSLRNQSSEDGTTRFENVGFRCVRDYE